jgi:hypothetical protein
MISATENKQDLELWLRILGGFSWPLYGILAVSRENGNKASGFIKRCEVLIQAEILASLTF